MVKSARSVVVAACFAMALAAGRSALAQYDAPATYYAAVTTQQGAALKAQLQTIISTGTVSFNYGDSRYILDDLWRDPNNASSMILYYTGGSVSGTWDQGVTWNREHIWPQSKLNVSVTNSTTGRAADLFELAPATPSANSARGNRNYGDSASAGVNGTRGSYYFPGDAWKGDGARSIFYMATRYSNGTTTASATNLIPVNGDPSALYNVGDLRSMIKWHFSDPVSVFEQRKNQVNYTSYQKNRNPYIDHPEWVHSVFVDNANDTQLSVGTVASEPDGGGASGVSVNLGRVLRNAPVPADQSVTIFKTGLDGTYFSVTPEGAARSDVTGRLNAFGVDVEGSRTVNVGLNTTTTTAGLKSGTVTVNNLDITTAGGAGRGANDANDVIDISLSVLDRSNSSFGAESDVNYLSIDFGDVVKDSQPASQSVTISNLASSLGASLTAGLDLDNITGFGDVARVLTNLGVFTNLAAGDGNTFSFGLDTSSLGLIDASFELSFSDENLPGTTTFTTLSIDIAGRVVMSLLPGDYNGDGTVDAADYTVWADTFGQSGTGLTADGNSDGVVDAADYTIWADNFGAGSAPAGVAGSVPEPGAMAFAAAAVSGLSMRRRR